MTTATATKPAPAPAVCRPSDADRVTGWQVRKPPGLGVEIGYQATRTTVSVPFADVTEAADELPSSQQQAAAHVRKLRDELAVAVKKALLASAEYPVYQEVNAEAAAHKLAAEKARARVDEMQAKRRRVSLEGGADLAERLLAIDQEVDAAHREHMAATQKAGRLATVLAERRTAALAVAARIGVEQMAVIRLAERARKEKAIAALITAAAPHLEALVACDYASRHLLLSSEVAKREAEKLIDAPAS